MTIGEAKAIYLRYLGEATVNGSLRNDPDLADQFSYLVNSAVIYVSSAFPDRVLVTLTDREWDAPGDFVSIFRTFDEYGMPVAYYEKGENHFIFDEICDVEYCRTPETILPGADDSTQIDLPERACELVPLKVAIDAALANPDYAYKVQFLTNTYNAMEEALLDAHMPSYRRVYGLL